jgi:competence ComEA-like helix-hairpin-helix protein
MTIFNFSKEDLRAAGIIAGILLFGFFINLCSGYSEWAAGSQDETIPESVSYPIDLNACGEAELIALPRVGAAIARRIIEYREKNEGFKTRCEIKNITGIGERFYESIKDKIFVSNDPSPDCDEYFDANEKAGSGGVYKIDINAASAEDFKNIKGLGRKVGEKIIEFRHNNGGRIESFKSLGGIEGIGIKRMRKINKHFIIY